LLFGVGSAIVTRYVPPNRRGLAFGLFGSIVGAALICGPVIGGLVAGNYGWPWIFWILVPISVLGLTASLILLPIEPGSYVHIPPLSSALWILAVVSATLLGEAFSKGLWVQYLPVTVAVVVLSICGLVWSEKRMSGGTRAPARGNSTAGETVPSSATGEGARATLTTNQPLFDRSIFANHVYRIGALTNFLSFIVIYPLIIFLPFYLEDYRGLDLEHAGMFLAISPLVTILIGPGSGHLADRIGYRRPVLGGLVITVVGYAALAAGVLADNLLLVGLALGVAGLGGALSGGPLFAAMMGGVSPQQRPIASSIGSLTRNLGFLSGTSLSAIAFGLLLWQRGGRELMLAARSEELAHAVAKADFLYAFGWVLIGSAVLSAIGLWVARSFPDKPLHQ